MKLINFINFLKYQFFLKCFDRFKNLWSQYPHHGIETQRLCQIIYRRLDPNSRTMLESICHDQFMNKEPIEVWQFLKDLEEKNLQQKITRKPDRLTSSRGGVHQFQPFLTTKVKIAILVRRIKAIELQRHSQVNQVSTSTCNGCNATDHTMEVCPLLMGPIENKVAQVNAAYHTPTNDSYAPMYNPRWRNHLNFS